MLLEQAKERRLLAAYVGLVAESATDPVLHDTLAGIETRALALADRVLDALEAAGRELTMERRLLVLSARVIANGLALELLQRGVTPELERGLALGAAGAPLLLFE